MLIRKLKLFIQSAACICNMCLSSYAKCTVNMSHASYVHKELQQHHLGNIFLWLATCAWGNGCKQCDGNSNSIKTLLKTEMPMTLVFAGPGNSFIHSGYFYSTS